MRRQDTKDVERFIDTREPDMTLRCINWCVDLYIFTDQPEKALVAKWSRVNYLLGVDPVCQTNVTPRLRKGGATNGY